MQITKTLAACGVIAIGAIAAGCSQGDTSGSGSGTTTGSTDTPWEHPSTDANGETGAAPADLAGGPLPPPSRGVRRMKIDTLQAAMSKVAGKDIFGNPIEWRFNNVNGFADGAFGKALGRPDFQSSTSEAGVSSALYLKFVGDAARDICSQMAKNDQLRTDATTRTLFPKAPIDGATDAQITANLQHLVLRFLGLRIAEDDAMIEPLRAVYDAGVSAAVEGAEIKPSAEGWRGVCVALFESPLFHND